MLLKCMKMKEKLGKERYEKLEIGHCIHSKIEYSVASINRVISFSSIAFVYHQIQSYTTH